MVGCQCIKQEAHASNSHPGINFTLKHINSDRSDGYPRHKSVYHLHKYRILLHILTTRNKE